LVIAALLEGGVELEHSIRIAIEQVRDYGTVPMKPGDMMKLEDKIHLDKVLASEILVDYYSDLQTIKTHYCLTCGERLDGTVTKVGQALLAHQIYHQHIEVLDQIDREGEDDA
jgi:hypothetical protein